MEAAALAVAAAQKMKRAGGSEAVRVVVRCRPLSSKEVRIMNILGKEEIYETKKR